MLANQMPDAPDGLAAVCGDCVNAGQQFAGEIMSRVGTFRRRIHLRVHPLHGAAPRESRALGCDGSGPGGAAMVAAARGCD